jgi:hypothetical protein
VRTCILAGLAMVFSLIAFIDHQPFHGIALFLIGAGICTLPITV